MTSPLSDHFDGKRFRNPNGVAPKGFFAALKWQLSGGKKDWPTSVLNTARPVVASHVEPGSVQVTFVNHATFLWQFASLNILTDPVYSERLSPVSFAGPKRVRPPGLAFSALPRIDVVLVSHNHYDHLDIETLVQLNEKFHPAFVVPLGNREYLSSRGIENVTELDWWETAQIACVGAGAGGATSPGDAGSAGQTHVLPVQLVPAQHWSARGLFDRNRALWGGFVAESDGVGAYFCGDSGYGAHFREIGERVGVIDVACLPIGAYEPRWFMRDQHMNPDDAVRALKDLGARRALAFHYGTFRLTDESIDDPVLDLHKALAAHGIPPDKFLALETGESVALD